MVVIAKLWQLILVGLITSASIAAVAAEAKPGCPHKCGDVYIPYPFGTKEGCYLNQDFLITCNYNETYPNTDPKAYLGLEENNAIVADISLEGEIRVLQYIAKDCYTENGSATYSNTPSLLADGNLYISAIKNKFVAVGCDTYAFLNSLEDGEGEYITGCMSNCNSYKNVPTNSCSGVGCCEVSIPKGLRHIETNVSSYNNHTDIWDFNPCGYAFVVDRNAFNFSASNLSNLHNVKRPPLVTDWAVGNETCSVAQQNKSSYACKENSECIPSNNGSGHLCKCKPNYEGNPYLSGCRGINFIHNVS